jgi:hypothetical protein
MLRSWAVAAALLSPALAAGAAPAGVQVGDRFEIVSVVESESHGDGPMQSSGSSYDEDSLVERVVAVGPEGLELEYDLISDTTAGERDRQWALPARVFKPAQGPMRLLNAPELETRAKAWLKTADLTEAACGRWYFTWTAFRIECDPQSVLKTLEGFDLGPDGLAEGLAYGDPLGMGPAPVKRVSGSADGSVFRVDLAVDPQAVRRQEAETDLVVAELQQKSLTLEAALQARSPEVITGTIVIVFETGVDGRVRRQTKTLKVSVKGASGETETKTVTQTLERRRL